MNKKVLPILIFPLTLSVFSCAPMQEIKTTIEVGEDITLLNNVKINEDKVVFDDFSGGVSYDNWIIANGFWGQGNGGVISD